MKGYIYLITNNINQKQYVGQTIKTIDQRFYSHINESKNKKDNMLIHKAMRKYGFNNFTIEEIISINSDTRENLVKELNNYEIFYISKYNTLTPNGYNMTKGGNEFREYSKIKIDEYDLCGNLLNTFDSYDDAARSINVSTDTAIRKCCLGISKFAFQKIWRLHGDPFDKYELPDVNVAIREYKLSPVDQYSINGTYIRTFDSIVSASLFLGLDSSNSHISECCQKKLSTAYGYVWRYKGEPFDIVKDNRNVSVEKYDKAGNLIEIFSTLKDACLSTGKYNDTVAGNIRRCIKGERQSAYGYVWKYTA